LDGYCTVNGGSGPSDDFAGRCAARGNTRYLRVISILPFDRHIAAEHCIQDHDGCVEVVEAQCDRWMTQQDIDGHDIRVILRKLLNRS
jgi:hypothetical protein